MKPVFAFIGLFAVLFPVVAISAVVDVAIFTLAISLSLALVVGVPLYIRSQPGETVLARLSRDGSLSLQWKSAELHGLTKDSFELRKICGFDDDLTNLHVLIAFTDRNFLLVAFSQLRPSVECIRSELHSHLSTA